MSKTCLNYTVNHRYRQMTSWKRFRQNVLNSGKLEIDKSRGIKPVKHLKAYDIPIHLREAAQAEFTEMRKAGIIVESDGEASEWSSQAFPRRKPNSWPIKCRWVTDFGDLNKALNRPIWGGESSGQLLRHIDPSACFFAVFDAISGFHQVAVNTESSKLFNITTQMGNFRYTVLGQGLCCSQDLFNFITSGSTQTNPSFNIHLKTWITFAYFPTQFRG